MQTPLVGYATTAAQRVLPTIHNGSLRASVLEGYNYDAERVICTMLLAPTRGVVSPKMATSVAEHATIYVRG